MAQWQASGRSDYDVLSESCAWTKKNVVKIQYQNKQDGDLLMDSPDSKKWDHLIKMAEDGKNGTLT